MVCDVYILYTKRLVGWLFLNLNVWMFLNFLFGSLGHFSLSRPIVLRLISPRLQLLYCLKDKSTQLFCFSYVLTWLSDLEYKFKNQINTLILVELISFNTELFCGWPNGCEVESCYGFDLSLANNDEHLSKCLSTICTSLKNVFKSFTYPLIGLSCYY